MPVPRVLTIAGSDSGGGAGIQADLKTFAALGVWGMSALTALTAQNTLGVTAVVELEQGFVEAQIDAVLSDIGANAAKTGMISSPILIETVAAKVRQYGLSPLVVDPVMVSRAGSPLLRPEAMDALRTQLLPLATVATPNRYEAAALYGAPLPNGDAARAAARAIHAMGPHFVVLKGVAPAQLSGDGDPADVLDLVFDGTDFLELRAPYIPTRNTHGTGCIFASAIAAEMAKGADPMTAITRARSFITTAIRSSLPLGHGFGPANPMAGIWRT